MVKNLSANVEDLGSVPRLGRYDREENGFTLQWSCLEKSMDRGAWQAMQSMGSQKDKTEQLTLSLSLFIFMCILNDFKDLSLIFQKNKLYLTYKFEKAQSFVTEPEKLVALLLSTDINC